MFRPPEVILPQCDRFIQHAQVTHKNEFIQSDSSTSTQICATCTDTHTHILYMFAFAHLLYNSHSCRVCKLMILNEQRSQQCTSLRSGLAFDNASARCARGQKCLCFARSLRASPNGKGLFCFARYYCFLTPTVCISNSCHIPCDHRQTHSGSEAGIHAAPVATVLPLTEASLNTEEPEIATEDKIAMIYHDLKRGHIYAQHKDRIPSANKASPACHDAA